MWLVPSQTRVLWVFRGMTWVFRGVPWGSCCNSLLALQLVELVICALVWSVDC